MCTSYILETIISIFVPTIITTSITIVVMMDMKTPYKCLSYKQTNEDTLLGIREWSRGRRGGLKGLIGRATNTGTHGMVCVQFRSIAENLIGKSVELLNGSWEPGH